MFKSKDLIQKITLALQHLHMLEIETRATKQNITGYLFPLLINEIYTIFEKIKECKNEKEARHYFSLLEEIQSLVALLISEGKIEIPDLLWKFYKEFDRIDLLEERKDLFNKIKHNYKLE